MEWGNNPDTLIALSTTLAFIAAAIAACFARKSYLQMSRQVDEARKQTASAMRQALASEQQTCQARSQTRAAKQQLDWAVEDRQRAQAEQVSAWTETATSDGKNALRIVLQNLSTAPVTNVRIATRMGTRKEPRYFYATQEDFLKPTGDSPHWIIPAKATGDHWTEWKRTRPRNSYPAVDIIFNDVRGVDWIRNADGQLERYRDGTKIPGHWWRSNDKQMFAPDN